MIEEFSVHPKPQNKNAKLLFLAVFLLSAVGFVTYFFMNQYRGIAGFIALMLLVTALLIYTKYISVEFYYDITKDSEGTPIFVVRQLIGKRQTTLCRISLWDILKIEKETASERRAHKTERNIVKYVYAPTLKPAVSYRITISNRYEKAEIIIEGTDEFIELLGKYSAEARLMRSEADDE